MLNHGDRLGAYQVISIIGRGGFGVVYKGVHHELGIDVAIKEYFPTELCTRNDHIIQPSKPEFQASFDESLDRFIQEARQLEKFRDCPYVVTCRDLFHANGTAYIVMDYVRGLSLSDFLQRREASGEPLTEEDLLRVTLPLLMGLKTVHQSDVCHRDIKPSNILIRTSDSTPVLIDFGAAKHEFSKYTKSFAPYSDGYAALEQIGEGEIGTWTDIYGVGAVMWRMVAGGAPPFSPPNPLTSQKRAFELMQGRGDPLPSAVNIGQKRFSRKILELIDRCLALNVNDRIQDCTQLLETINHSDAHSGFAYTSSVLEGEKKFHEEQVLDQTDRKSNREIPDRKINRLPLISLGIIACILVLIFALLNSRDATNREVEQGQESSLSTTEQGSASSPKNFGEMYYHGNGVSQSFLEAVKWFRLAANQGDMDAQRMLAEMYYNGEGVSQSYEEAAQWFLRAARQGDVRAQAWVGHLYYNGLGVSKDEVEGINLYQTALGELKVLSHQGDADAQGILGFMYLNGEGVQKDELEGLKFYRMAANQGLAWVQRNLGIQYYTGEVVPKDDQEAIKWIRRAADQGNAIAQLLLGLMYDNGEGIPENDREAVKWYRLAAEQQLPEAQLYLGFSYDLGEGVLENNQEAVKWYRLAAEQGFAEAQFYLGRSYDLGEGIPENDQEAVKWYRLAAEQQYVEAQFYLGLSYELGEGVPEDIQESIQWYRMAAEQGHELAQDELNKLLNPDPAPIDEISFPAGLRSTTAPQQNLSSTSIPNPTAESSASTIVRDFFTRGSHSDDVRQVQGTPRSIDTYDALGHEVWRYNSSTIDIDLRTQRVLRWNNSSGNLKVILDPDILRPNVKNFTRGSHSDVVLQVQGTPRSIDTYDALGHEVWRYNSSTIDIDLRTRNVLSWNNSSGNLRVVLEPKIPRLDVESFTRGSHSDVVLQVQGTPRSIDTYDALGHEVWRYNSSTIDIDLRTRNVLSWNNSSGNLRVVLEPKILRPGVESFTQGSHSDVVLQVQGTPRSIDIYDALGHEVWRYNSSTINIDLRSKRVLSWDNSSGNLRIK